MEQELKIVIKDENIVLTQKHDGKRHEIANRSFKQNEWNKMINAFQTTFIQPKFLITSTCFQQDLQHQHQPQPHYYLCLSSIPDCLLQYGRKVYDKIHFSRVILCYKLIKFCTFLPFDFINCPSKLLTKINLK